MKAGEKAADMGRYLRGVSPFQGSWCWVNFSQGVALGCLIFAPLGLSVADRCCLKMVPAINGRRFFVRFPGRRVLLVENRHDRRRHRQRTEDR